jgi:hypothetical protein
MDTIHSFAMGCLAVALAVAAIGLAIGSEQLQLAASVISVICVVTLIVVNGTKPRRGR